MAVISNIGVHHFAGILTLDQVNKLHKSEWPDMPSELRPDLYVGYNFIIWRDGTWLQTRFIGEETCAQVGHNFDTVSLSLVGDFSVGKDQPTFAQVATLRNFLVKLTTGDFTGYKIKTGTTINIPKTNIFPHRVLQPNHTQCYGSSLSDDWARRLLPENVAQPSPSVALPISLQQSNGPQWTIIQSLLQRLIQSLQALKGRPVGDCINNARG